MKNIELFKDCFPPVYDENSEVLVLGSNPPPNSRNAEDPETGDKGFYYSDPRNRFWKTIAEVFNEKVPQTFQEKKDLCYRHKIALWDVFKSCSRIAGQDATIKDEIPNDFKKLLSSTKIKHIFCLGEKAFKGYQKYCAQETGINATKLTSSSGLASSKKFEDLVQEYKIIKEILEK